MRLIDSAKSRSSSLCRASGIGVKSPWAMVAVRATNVWIGRTNRRASQVAIATATPAATIPAINAG